MIQLRSIAADNFLSFGSANVAFDATGLTLVTGRNGQGKSALVVEAPAWCLWGKSARGGDPLRGATADVRVSVALDVDGRDLRVTRCKAKGKSAKVELTVDDASGPVAEFMGPTMTATQDKLTAAIGTFESFVATVLFTKGAMLAYSQADNAHREVLVDDLFGVSAPFDRASTRVRAQVDAENAEVAVALNATAVATAERNAAARTLVTARATAESAHKDAADAEDALAQAEASAAQQVDVAGAEALASAARNRASTCERALAAAKANERAERALHAAALTAALRTRDDAGPVSESAAETLVACVARVTALSARVAQLTRESDGIKSVVTRAASMVGVPCPTCLRTVETDTADKVAAHYEADLAKLTETLDAARTALAAERAEEERLTQARAVARAEFKAAATAHADATNAAQRFAQQHAALVEGCQDALTTASARAAAANAAVAAARSAREVNESRVAEREQRARDTAARLVAAQTGHEAAKTALVAAEAEIGALVARQAAHEARLAVLSAAATVLGVRGARVRVMAAYLASASDAATTCVQRLEPGATITLTTERALKKGTTATELGLTTSGVGKTGNYDDASEGERRRVDLAVMLGLAETAAARGGPRWAWSSFDEVFDILDDEGCERASDLLCELSAARHVVVISHSPAVRAHFPDARVLRVTAGVVDEIG